MLTALKGNGNGNGSNGTSKPHADSQPGYSVTNAIFTIGNSGVSWAFPLDYIASLTRTQATGNGNGNGMQSV